MKSKTRRLSLERGNDSIELFKTHDLSENFFFNQAKEWRQNFLKKKF